MTFSVHSKMDLESVIIPFFEEHPLLIKQEDFRTFSEVVRMMRRKAHKTDDGLRAIIELAFSMNQRGKQRKYRIEEVLAEPSETVRQAPLFAVKIQSEPHGDMRRATEMIAPPAGTIAGGNSVPKVGKPLGRQEALPRASVTMR
jgi:hypothetical protein